MIRIRQVKVDVYKDKKEELERVVASKLGISPKDIISLNIERRSIDARDKKHIIIVYEVDVCVENEDYILHKKGNKDIFLKPNEEYIIPLHGDKIMSDRPIVVGSGPAGLFASYLLAQEGYFPLIIERGEKVEDRVKSVESFWKDGVLNPESNVSFGEGGAGTFSDGKLNTLVKDKNFRMKKVFEIFVECGAPKEILYVQNPHIGTDLLREVVKNMREKIIKMGGEFRYQTMLTDLIIQDNKIVGVELNNKEKVNASLVILAIGNSARETITMIHKHKVEIVPKPFAVGVRIQHKQQLINERQYGDCSLLYPASYKLTYQAKNKRGVYSFCMCPGGYVVNASIRYKYLVINGMSDFKRDSMNANSAIVVTVSPDDFGKEYDAGIRFQQELENASYLEGKGKIPIQTYQDFINNQVSTSLGEIEPVLKGGYTLSNLNTILPDFVTSSIKEALIDFNRKIPGFTHPDTLLCAVESRTSSPVRIIRNSDLMSNIEGLFPCGEGSGYAGGITTSAMDGLKVAEVIIKKYKQLKSSN